MFTFGQENEKRHEYFPKDEAEYAAARAYTYAKELLHVTQHGLDDSLDYFAIMKMAESMAGMEEALVALKDWIKKVRNEEDDIGSREAD